MKFVIAIGGNAVNRPGEKPTAENMMKNLRETMEYLVDIIKDHSVVITHGNGPQVGNLLLQNEIAKDTVPPMPLHVLNAETQAMIGYILQQNFQNVMRKLGCKRSVTTVITQVVVNENDPAFRNPTKFIGPFYSKEEAERLSKERGWIMKEDPRGGWRRVVPSPMPIDIVEKDVIKRLYLEGNIVIAAGGGGIPVIMKNGVLIGVDAVIDKDLASSLLASILGIERFIILTDVDFVMLNYGKKNQRPILKATLDEIKRYYKEGHFPPGSMGPKILAAIQFLERGGKEVIIGNLNKAEEVFEGKSGTLIVR